MDYGHGDEIVSSVLWDLGVKRIGSYMNFKHLPVVTSKSTADPGGNLEVTAWLCAKWLNFNFNCWTFELQRKQLNFWTSTSIIPLIEGK
jgi:hypothetical protein